MAIEDASSTSPEGSRSKLYPATFEEVKYLLLKMQTTIRTSKYMFDGMNYLDDAMALCYRSMNGVCVTESLAIRAVLAEHGKRITNSPIWPLWRAGIWEQLGEYYASWRSKDLGLERSRNDNRRRDDQSGSGLNER